MRKLGVGLLLGTGAGKNEDVLPMLKHGSTSLSSDDSARLRQTLADIKGKK